MDTRKIGIFLKELRKQNNMTQEQLGEKVGVTNKTVSRWENGNYLPPIECLKLLSEIYQISINEILTGRRLSEVEYVEASEENIAVALEEMEQEEKNFENKMLIIMGITTVLAIVIMFLLLSGNDLSIIEKIIIVVLVCAMEFVSNTVSMVALALKKKR